VNGTVVWLTGLPAAGKSTLAQRLLYKLKQHGRAACILDSDVVRQALVPALGYDDQARAQFYTTLANLAALLASQGVIVIVAATANRRQFRQYARERAPTFFEVLVDASPEEVKARDSKGLYALAAQGKVQNVPGVDVEYEPPEAPDVVASGGKDDAAIDRLCRILLSRVS
jgi:adenylylsulfate kinase